jgi:hypothetical protein
MSLQAANSAKLHNFAAAGQAAIDGSAAPAPQQQQQRQQQQNGVAGGVRDLVGSKTRQQQPKQPQPVRFAVELDDAC